MGAPHVFFQWRKDAIKDIHLLLHAFGVVGQHVFSAWPVLNVEKQVVPCIDVVMLPKVDEVDDLSINHHGSDKVHGPRNR